MAGTLTVQNIQGPTSGANANKIIIPSGQTLDASSGTFIPDPGAVVQTVSGFGGDNTTITTTNTFTDTNLSLAITPKYSTSKLIVWATQPMRMQGTGSIIRTDMRITLSIGGASATAVYNTNYTTEMFQVRGTPGEVSMVGAFVFGSTPATTSECVYTLQMYLTGDSGVTNCVAWSGTRGASMVIQEVAQ